MEGQTRTNLNYLEQLYKFHHQQGHPVFKIPRLDKRPMDLFQLKKEVAARGGYHKAKKKHTHTHTSNAALERDNPWSKVEL